MAGPSHATSLKIWSRNFVLRGFSEVSRRCPTASSTFAARGGGTLPRRVRSLLHIPGLYRPGHGGARTLPSRVRSRSSAAHEYRSVRVGRLSVMRPFLRCFRAPLRARCIVIGGRGTKDVPDGMSQIPHLEEAPPACSSLSLQRRVL